MTDIPITDAVIYCRVSSNKQVKKGDGLGSQETRCREYAGYKDYEIVEVFRDEGVSGGLIDRLGMRSMLAYLKKGSSKKQHAVIIDDISRLARGLDAHIQLRTAIGSCGGKLESPSIEFADDSDSVLVENLLASVSQHQRQKNAEQVVNRMRARLMNGYWVFQAPIGYKFKSVPGNGKVLERDEPIATILTESLEGYASGRFSVPAEIKRFLEAQPLIPKDRNGEVHFQRIEDLLTRSFYTGYITYEKWGINLVPAKHESLISFETFKKIQNLHANNTRVPARKDIQDDFPLRGFVTCGCCDEPMTSCWSKGRNAKYPYYLCFNKACPDYRKSIKREQLESDFEILLKDLVPNKELLVMAFEMFRELWEHQNASAKNRAKTMQKELSLADRKIGLLLDRIVDANSETLIQAYEKRVKDLESHKIEMREKIDNFGRPAEDFSRFFRTAFEFLANPCNLWASDRLEDRRAVLKMVFAEKLPYHRKEGFSNR